MKAGLTAKTIKNCDYHEVVAKWLGVPHRKTDFYLVQFEEREPNERPRTDLATSKKIAKRML